MFRRHANKHLRQGDIALVEFHQLRATSNDRPGPGAEPLANDALPYLGPYQDFEIPVQLPGRDEPLVRVLRVWAGPAMVVDQSCEIEYADANDSRLIVAPIVSRAQWPVGPWDLIERGELPGYLHLPAAGADGLAAQGIEFAGGWPEAAVVFAGTTLLSHRLVKPNRFMTLAPDHVTHLQQQLVRFSSVRGWGSIAAMRSLEGATILSVEQTAETIPGPVRLAKVFTVGDNGDEITVGWGLRS